MVVVYVFGLVLSGFAVFSLCSNILYWYESLNTDSGDIPTLRPGLWRCLRMYVISVCGYLTCVGLFPLGPLLRRKPGPGADATLPPVVLVHGLNNNASAWLYLGRVLGTAGFGVSTYSYSSLFVPLERIMERFDAHIRRVEALGLGRPVLVCHSLGGLLARNWLRTPGNAARIGGLITLGTPHGGSKLAVFAPGALGQSITPRGSLVRALREAAQPEVPCVSLVSPTDEAVLPAAHLAPPAGTWWRMRVTSPVGHYSMLYCPAVARMVIEEARRLRAH